MVPTESTERLQQEAEADFEAFHDIAMDFQIERIMIDNDDIDVYVHWQGLWKKDPEDPGLRQRGHSRFQWVGTKSILLQRCAGRYPVRYERRQALTNQAPAFAAEIIHDGHRFSIPSLQLIFSSSAAVSPVFARRWN